MTDRELLEMAAKACGYPISEGYYEESTNGAWWVYVDGSGEPPNDSAWTEIWNPLTDDGDALRLAIKLGFGFDISNGATWIKPIALVSETTAHLEIAPHSDDPYAATRRAIVRAAAEIGKGMK